MNRSNFLFQDKGERDSIFESVNTIATLRELQNRTAVPRGNQEMSVKSEAKTSED